MTYQEQVLAQIEKATSPKTIFNILRFGENEANELNKMIVENSNDFTKSIAEQAIEAYTNTTTNTDEYGNEQEIPTNVKALSDKQVWCLSYQVFNNKSTYLN